MMFLFISLNVPIIASIFIRNTSFHVGLGVVPFLLMANVFLGIYFNLSIWYKLTDKTKFGGIISGIGLVITVIGNILLIPVLGYYGSAITTLLCYGTMMVISYRLGQQHFPVPYQVKSALFYILITAGIAAIAFMYTFEHPILELVIKNSVFLLFLGVFYVKEKAEIQAIFLRKK